MLEILWWMMNLKKEYLDGNQDQNVACKIKKTVHNIEKKRQKI